MTDPNGISITKYVESIVVGLEKTVRDQITGLRTDIEHLQRNYITRAEFDAIHGTVQRDLARVERQCAEQMRTTKDDHGKQLGEMKEDYGRRLDELREDIKASQQRAMWMIGLGLTAITFVVNLIVNLMT